MDSQVALGYLHWWYTHQHKAAQSARVTLVTLVTLVVPEKGVLQTSTLLLAYMRTQPTCTLARGG